MQSLRKLSKMAVLLLMLFVLSGCSIQEEYPVRSENKDFEIPATFRISRSDGRICPMQYEKINLHEYDSDLHLTRGGAYRLTGSLRGSVYIDCQDENIQLVLAGASIEGKGAPAIMVESAGKLFITAEEDTENQLKDIGRYKSLMDADACVYAKCDITINGKGSLVISGLYKDAVCSKDTLRVMASNLMVRSKRDGLRGNDGVYLSGDNVRIESEKNGIRTAKVGEGARGNVEILCKSVSIISGKYCINAVKDLYIHDASFYMEGIWDDYNVGGRIVIEEDKSFNEQIQT